MTRRPPSAANRPSNRDGSTRPPRTRPTNGIPYPGAPDPAGSSARTRRSAKRPAATREPAPIPPTVWTAGPDPIDPAATWPVPIIETITTSFSAPGARVLLAPWPAAEEAASRAEHVGELDAALDAVHALGRHPAITKLESQTTDEASTSGATTSASVAAVERVDLVITSLPPERGADGSVETLALAAAQVLAFGGILAVYTYSDWSSGRLTDPSGPMIAAGQNADLLYLQHIVTLHTPIRNGRLQPPTATDRTDGARGGREPAAPTTHTRAHGDVLVFAQAHADATQPEDLR
ncbi:hypothetical protein [Amycolatopsis balhimycina]|uniref:hypothetical protein n=1 Tax=Amycolatopsis TaxID=1813 RepID=UPI000F78DC39|nr:hypothetical protein [Amycolatopsis balhimycina]